MAEPVRNSPLGCVLVLAATVCISTDAPLVRCVALPALLICAVRSSLGGLLLLPFLFRGGIPISRWTAMYIAGYTGVWILVCAAIQHTHSAIAVGMQFTALAWLVGLSALAHGTWRGEPWRQALLVLAGLVLFMASSDGGTIFGNVLAFLSSIALVFLNLGSKRAGTTNPLGLTCLGNLVQGCILLLVLPDAFARVAALTGREWVFLCLLALLPVTLGMGLYNLGMRHVQPEVASLLASFEMILAPVWVAIFQGETSRPLVLAGLAFIFAGVFWCALKGMRSGRKEQAPQGSGLSPQDRRPCLVATQQRREPRQTRPVPCQNRRPGVTSRRTEAKKDEKTGMK